MPNKPEPERPKRGERTAKTQPPVVNVEAASSQGSSPEPAANATDANIANTALLQSIKAMMDEMRSDIISKLDSTVAETVKRELKDALKPMENKIQSQQRAIAELERSATERDTTVAELQATVSVLTDLVESLSDKCETLESRSRWSNVILVGLKESSEGPRPTESIAKLLKELLQLDELPVLDRCHRSLRAKPKDSEPPRPLIMKVHYFQTRNLILRQARECSPLMYKDVKLSIFPDFTQAVRKKRALFAKVKKELHSCPGVKFGLMYPAVLRITLPSGQTRKFEDPEKAMNFVVKNIKKVVNPDDVGLGEEFVTPDDVGSSEDGIE